MKKLLWIVGGLIAVFLLIQWSRADYLEFKEKREAWHKRCDAYVGENATEHDTRRAEDCRREAAELLAYARQKGWAKN